MEVGLGRTLLAGDPRLIDHIVGEVKSQGIFDQFRKECIADVDTKPAYQNLRTRVESSVNTFLGKQIWKPDMNKNQLRENLRKHIHDAAYLDAGVERIVDQVVNPKVYSVFMPQIEDVVYKFLGMERPKNKDRNGAKSLKDLLPKDLDPVSPESDKNSLKDDSLESVDSNLGVIVGKNSRSLSKDTSTVETKSENIEDKSMNDDNSANKHSESLENQLECNSKNSSKNISASNLNISSKSDEKTEEEEEDSPVFEPIDIMNFNESNDSHLSGISELTSHRSRSPDFINDFSRDNLDFSNHDSQLSKASSDSRLSIVTDFGLSNHAPTPMPETLKDDSNKEKSIETSDPKVNKDNFKAIRDIESNKANIKELKNSFETIRGKDNQTHESKDFKDLKSVKGIPDSMEGGTRHKNDSKDSKDTCKENDSSKTKSSKEKSDAKESKSYKDRDKDHKRRQSGHSNSSKHDKSDKYSRDKYKDKTEKSRDSYEKGKEHQEKSREADKTREDKKDSDKKDSVGKDLKDMYKEKIRELREKKELTEKEKSAKDPKEAKPIKESRDKKDSSKDRKDSKSSSSKGSSRFDEKLNSKSESKSSSKAFESKDSKYENKDKGKRDDKRQSKDSKDNRNKSHSSAKADTTEKSDKSDNKKDLPRELGDRYERSDAKRDIKPESQKAEVKKDSKTESQNRDYERIDKLESKRDTKIDSQGKERKKKDEKKNKIKDDHSSLRKNPNDRRSTDRDGSNGSNGKSSQKSSSNSIANASKTGSTTLNKESSGTSNSSSETSDNMDISPSDETKLPLESTYKDNDSRIKSDHLSMKTAYENQSEAEYFLESDLMPERVDLGQNELSLPLKKRPLQSDVAAPDPSDFKVKKPKFAKNFQEAKKLMKIRKKLEKQRLKEYEAAKMKFQLANHINDSNKSGPMSMVAKEQTVPTLPDEERVQIIEVTDDEYEEPYPDLSMKEINISLDQQSINSLENPLVLNNSREKLENVLEKQSSLSVMEQSIRQGLEDMISDKKLLESESSVKDTDDSTAKVKPAQSEVDNGGKLPDITTNNLKQSNNNVNNPIPFPTEKKTNMEKESSKNLNSQEKRLKKVDPLKICKKNQSDPRSQMLSGSVTSQCIKEHPKHQISPSPLDDNDNCLYFEADNERAEKFSKFLESLELEIDEDESHPQNFSSESLERILESLGGRIVSALPKTMAPPMAKRKHSTSPLTDILLNNTYNNNNRHKAKESSPEEELNTSKKRRMGRPKKQQAIANVCGIPSLPNGENFVMPLSPESDVSASSEKTSLHLLKEDKSRQRSSQRYSSDDLYKPRPFFSSSSRRSRRSNQA
ncbi:biorientation of chromosomes in cell division protein 1-like 1 isoform X2 [Athalia rosae]|uniref:biorientation of chromosomes in cell division protein 1-like 1 isoform X2 n=1 Tax=Athalia rosae TaxID=37344 RepID=UPI0020347288|nr:biorientation of chromosomes in cell division protein 1-like 1 isoform X2 [Athalia rosae]